MKLESINPCIRWQEELQRELDGESLQDVVFYQNHRNDCPECRSAYRNSRLLCSLAISLPIPEIPRDRLEKLTVNILSELEREAETSITPNGPIEKQPVHKRGIFVYPRSLLVIAASLLIGGLAVFLNPWSRPSDINDLEHSVARNTPDNQIDPNLVEKSEIGSIREKIAQAESALAQFSKDTTQATIQNSIPKLPVGNWFSAEQTEVKVPKADDTDFPTLRVVYNSVQHGFSPLSRSTKKAFGLFFQEITLNTDRLLDRSDRLQENEIP